MLCYDHKANSNFIASRCVCVFLRYYVVAYSVQASLHACKTLAQRTVVHYHWAPVDKMTDPF